MPNYDDKDKHPHSASAEGGEKYLGEHLGKGLSTFFLCVSMVLSSRLNRKPYTSKKKKGHYFLVKQNAQMLVCLNLEDTELLFVRPSFSIIG